MITTGHQLAAQTGQRPRFQLGKIVATPGAIQALYEYNDAPAEYLARHARGDWGDVPPEDAESNEAALRDDERVISAYTLPGTEQRIWIITEWDRSVTTILLPEEY